MVGLETELIVVIVERGKADKVVKQAKKAGAKGATVFYARGTGEADVLRLIGRTIDQAKEVILILVERGEQQKRIMEAIVETGKISEPGTGIAFCLPITHLFGLHRREDIKAWNNT